MPKRLAAMLALLVFVAGCVPTTYFQYKGNYYRIRDDIDGLALAQLKKDGTWYGFESRATPVDVTRYGEKLTTEEINEEIARRRCAAGECPPPVSRVTESPGGGGHY